MSGYLRECSVCGTRYVALAEEPAGQPICSGCRLVAPPDGRQRGLVKWFSRSKGYGFITPTDGPELFLHKSGMQPGQPLPGAGQLVEYRIDQGRRGAQAMDVQILSGD